MQLAEGFIFIADEAIGQKSNDAQALRIVWKSEAGAQAVNQHGSAGAVHRCDVLEGNLDVVLRGGDRNVGEFAGLVAEVNDLETVGGVHVGQRVVHSGLGLPDGTTVHAA